MKKTSIVTLLLSAVVILTSACSYKTNKQKITTIETERVIKFNDQENSPAATVQIIYEYITDATPNSTEDVVNQENILYAFGAQEDGLTPEKIIDNYIANYEKEYRSNLQYFADKGEELGPIFNYELILFFKHFNSSKNSIAFVKDMYIYMGGVHGAQNIIYHTYDLNTGKEMRARDIFLEGSQQELRNIIYEGFKAEYFPGRNQTSQDGGFFNLEENMTLDNTYVFTDKGLLFQYQAYAIAPYSFGMPSVVIPYAKLKNVLNKENAVVKDYL